eukprot:1867667-Pyramimonas_sp.AAC.1
MGVLRGQIQDVGSVPVDVSKRLGALLGSPHASGNFWHAPGAPVHLKRSVHLGIQNAGMQNLEADIATECQCKRTGTVFIEHC